MYWSLLMTDTDWIKLPNYLIPLNLFETNFFIQTPSMSSFSWLNKILSLSRSLVEWFSWPNALSSIQSEFHWTIWPGAFNVWQIAIESERRPDHWTVWSAHARGQRTNYLIANNTILRARIILRKHWHYSEHLSSVPNLEPIRHSDCSLCAWPRQRCNSIVYVVLS